LSTPFVFLYPSSHTFFSFVVPVTGDILGDLSLFCVLSRFSCAFYLTNIYCKVVCCSPISVLTFSYQHVYGPKSFAPGRSLRVLATLFLSPCLIYFSFFFALMLILDGLFHSLSITLVSPDLPLHSFDHLVDVFSDSCRLSVTMAYLLSPSLNLCASNNDFVLFFVSVSQNKS